MQFFRLFSYGASRNVAVFNEIFIIILKIMTNFVLNNVIRYIPINNSYQQFLTTIFNI